MIKRNWKLIAVCAFVQCFVSALFAAPLRGGVNVKDFGAKGDGITDDTAAFSAAAKAIWLNAKAESKSRRQRFRKEKTGSKEGPRQCLYVPKGRYILSGTVVFGSDAFVVGEDGVELIGTDSAKDIFYVHGAYRVRFENLAFSGGRSHLKVETLNKDTANVLVTGCRFRKSAATAFYSPSFGIDGKGVGEWIYDAAQGAFVKNERYLSKELRGNNHSTMIVIDNCLFEHCGRAIEMDPDGSVLRNSRFIMAPGATNAAIFASNQIHAYGLDIAHYAGSAAFECDGKVAMWFEDSSVTTLDGSGARVLRGKVSNSTQAAHLIMADIRTDAGLAKGNAICSFQGAFPAIASLVRVKAEGPNEVKAFSFTPEENVEAFDASRRIKVWEPDRFFSYGIRDCSANIVKPAGFAKRFLREVPKWAAAAGGARCRLERPEMKGAVRKWMNPKWHVNFRTCEINRDTVVECSGVAALVGLGPDAPWFVVKKGAKAVFRNLQVHGGQSFVVVEDGAEAYVDSCYVYDGESSAFVCHKGGCLVVDNGVYCTARLYEGEGDAFIRSVWHTFTDIVPQDMPLADESSIVNRGKLVLWDVLGVPQVFSRFIKKFPTWDPVTEYSVRWVDNHGDFMSRMVRYGSERGGVTPVWHHGNARTLIEGHYAGFWNRSIPHTPVMCDAPNSDVKIFGVAFSQSRHRLKHIEMLWRDGKGVKRTMPDAQMYFTCPTKDVSDVSEIRPAAGAENGKTAEKKDKSKFHIFLLAGQSNMAGRGSLNATNRISASRVVKLDASGCWVPADEPIHFDKAAAGAGLAASFARAVADRDPSITVGLVPAAWGGTCMDEWNGERACTMIAIQRTLRAMEDGELKAILWHQGCSDAGKMENVESYMPKLSNTVSFMRSWLKRPDVPFIAGELADCIADNPQVKIGKGTCCWKEFNERLHGIKDYIPNSAVVDGKGFKFESDGVHLDTQSLRTFGLRYADAYFRLSSEEKSTNK